MRPKPRNYSKRQGTRLAAQLAEAAAAYGRELGIDQLRPRTSTSERKPGRPRRGKGVKVISVSVERGLLQRCDELARALGLSRARLIDRGLRIALAANGR